MDLHWGGIIGLNVCLALGLGLPHPISRVASANGTLDIIVTPNNLTAASLVLQVRSTLNIDLEDVSLTLNIVLGETWEDQSRSVDHYLLGYSCRHQLLRCQILRRGKNNRGDKSFPDPTLS